MQIFTTLTLETVGENQVRVSGVTGKAAPDKLKLTIGRMEGYMRELIFTVGYPQTKTKFAQLKGMIESAWEGLPIERVAYSFLGQNSLYGDVVSMPDDPIELIVRVMFTAKDESTLKTAVRVLMTNGLSGPAGMSISGTTISGNPRITLGLFPTLVRREHIQTSINYEVVE